jgi:WD domain, G-beta repeat
MMAGDLYWEWLRVPPEKRPPNHFDLLGLPADVADVAAIEQAAGRQVQRVKEQLDGPQAAEGAKLLQEIAAARTTLIDPAKRARYVASLASPGSPAASPQPWWQDASKKPAAKPATQAGPATAVKPVPVVKTVAPAKPSAFQGMTSRPGARPTKKSGPNLALLLVFGGGAALVLVAAVVAAVVVFGSGSTKTEQAQNSNSEKQNTGPSKPAGPSRTNHEPENHEPSKSEFLTEIDPPPDANAKLTATKKFERHTGLVQALSLAPHGRRFLSGGEGGVFEWDLSSAKSFLRHQFKNVPATSSAYLPGTRLYACADEGSVVIRDLATNQTRNTLKCPRGLLLAMAAASDGRHLLTGGNDGTLRWWDVNLAEPEKEIEAGDSVQVYCVAVSRDGKLAAAGGKDGSLGVWEIASKKKLWQSKQHRNSVTAVAFSPDSKRIASASLDNSVAVWDADGGARVALFPGHETGAYCVSFLDKSPGLVSGGHDNTLRFWNLESGLSLRTLSLAASPHCLAVGPGDAFVIVGGAGGMLLAVPRPELDFETIVKEEPPEKKLPLPAAEDVDAALSALRLKLKQELESAKADDLAALAERLFQKAGGKVLPSQRLALFREARELFTKAGKLESALKTIDQTDRWFEIDDLGEKTTVLIALIPVTPAPGQKAIVELGLKLLQRTDSEARPDLGTQILPALDQAAEKSAVPELKKSIATLRKQRETEAMAVAKLNELQTKLKAAPNDKELNLTYGLLLCSRHEWKDGLAHLAKGSDAKLADLAAQDIKEPKEAKPRFELGQAWADAAEKAADAKLTCLQRAKYWVERAEPGLFGEDKPKATLLLGQVSAKISTLAPKEAAGGPDKPAPRKIGEPVVRRNFNTLRDEATFKTQWKIEGSSRWENSGLRLLENPVSLQSTFQLIDNWRMEIVADYDGRELVIQVNKQTITLQPTRNEPVIYLERKGKKLSYVLANLRALPTVNTISLPDDALLPSAISIKLEGVPYTNRKEGMLLPRIVVAGPVKVEE